MLYYMIMYYIIVCYITILGPRMPRAPARSTSRGTTARARAFVSCAVLVDCRFLFFAYVVMRLPFRFLV